MAIAFDFDDSDQNHSHHCIFSSLYLLHDKKLLAFNKIHVTGEIRTISICNYYEEDDDGIITFVCGKLYIYSNEGILDNNKNLTLQKFEIEIRKESSRSLKCLHDTCGQRLLPVYLRLSNQTHKKFLLGLKLCKTHLLLYKVESRSKVVEFIF